MSNICPSCEVGELVEHLDTDSLMYNGVLIPVEGVLFSSCPACGEEVVLPSQAKANDIAYADAKRRHDGLLTSVEIRAWRDLWELSQHQAAELFGGGANAFSKYERGEVLQSKPMDLLMRLYGDVPGVRTKLAEYAGVASGWETACVDAPPVMAVSIPAMADIVLMAAYRAEHHHRSEGMIGANDDSWSEQSWEAEPMMAVGGF